MIHAQGFDRFVSTPKLRRILRPETGELKKVSVGRRVAKGGDVIDRKEEAEERCLDLVICKVRRRG